MQRVHLNCVLCAALGLWLVSSPGCASRTLLNWKSNDLATADEKNPVARIICIWEPAEGNGVDGVPTRGFAGQILFFTRGNPSPARVQGDVRVFLFDDYGTTQEQAKPIHQFDFLGKAWDVHLQKSTLGPAYNLFIPYVRKHVYQVSCALRVRFKPEHGAPVYSEIVEVTLPGVSRGEKAAPPTLQAAENPKPLGATIEHRQISAAEPMQPGQLDASALGGSRPMTTAEADHAVQLAAAFEDAKPRRGFPTGEPAKRTKVDQAEQLLLEKMRDLRLESTQALPPTLPANFDSEETIDDEPGFDSRRLYRLTPAESAEQTGSGRLGNIFDRQASAGDTF